MIRRLMNLVRGRHPDFSTVGAPRPIASIDRPRSMPTSGSTSGSLGFSPRRGITLSPMGVVKADRRAASKRARVARRAAR